MYRLSLIVEDVFRKFLPEATKAGIQLNLDFPDPTKKVKNPERLKASLEKNVDSALKRAKKGEVSIKVLKDRIEIFDSGTVLSLPAKSLLQASDRVKVSSRVGFGTKVTISLD